MDTVGTRIKRLRKEANLTQAKLARKLPGATQAAITLWENDKTAPSSENLLGLALLLKTTPSYILTGTTKSSTEQAADAVAEELGTDAVLLLALYRKANENGRRTLFEMAKLITKLNPEDPKTAHYQEDTDKTQEIASEDEIASTP